MLFLDYDVNGPTGLRISRFWSAFPDTLAYLPLTLVDSGDQWHSGPAADLASLYRQMVEQSLARPPKAELSAYWWRQGDYAWFHTTVTNRSGEPLSQAGDRATVHVLAFESPESAPGHRWVRGAEAAAVGVQEALLPGASETRVLATTASNVDWSRMGGAVIFDYRPSSDSDAYDTLQAAVATRLDAPLSVSQQEVLFMIDGGDTIVPSARIRFSGIPALTWAAQADQPWITMNRDSGDLTQACVLSVSKGELVAGWQEATVTFSAEADAQEFSQQVTVRVYAGDLSRTHMPLLVR